MTSSTKIFLLKVLIHLGALLPLMGLYFSAFEEDFDSDPVEVVIHFKGPGAINSYAKHEK